MGGFKQNMISLYQLGREFPGQLAEKQRQLLSVCPVQGDQEHDGSGHGSVALAQGQAKLLRLCRDQGQKSNHMSAHDRLQDLGREASDAQHEAAGNGRRKLPVRMWWVWFIARNGSICVGGVVVQWVQFHARN